MEQIWVPWAAGATVVPKPAGSTLLGADLSAFLLERRITALCCVPTLLTTIEDELAQVRFLLVSGEACPQDLIERWYRPERRFLNVYGPTEATVTATWTELHPDRAVTIGVPLPTYAVVVLDPDDPGRALPQGEVGEIGIAGVALARGYVNREEKTREVFVPDFLGLDAITPNPSGRIYRTGDLGRIRDDGEVEYHGRIDLQVKVRGYRIELTEIESVLLQVPGVAAAVVDTHEPAPGSVELVGYYTERSDSADDVDPAAIHKVLSSELPPYMVPAFLEPLDEIPLTTNDKADRANLPAPTGGRTVTGGEHVEAATESERCLAEALAEVLGVDQVSVTANVFDELGATSLLVARFTARLRELAGGATVSIRDVYEHPTVRELAGVVGDVSGSVAPGGAARGSAPEADHVVTTSTIGYVLTGGAQLLVLLAGVCLVALLLDVVYSWVFADTGVASTLGRAAMFTAATFVGLCAVPIAAKWLLVGRWKPGEIPLWSPAYFRFWLVKVLVQINPLALFAGSPLYVLYLRALGAKVGKDVLVLSRVVPVATDLITIGSGTVIRKVSSFTGYRALPGRLQIGAVTLGADVVVGEQTVLDVDTRMQDRAQLGHSSALLAGTAVPEGQSWHGSPAEPTGTDHRGVPDAQRGGVVRKIVFSSVLLLATLALGVLVWVLVRIPRWVAPLGTDQWAASTPVGILALLVVGVAAVALFALLALRLAATIVLPRLLAPLVRPDRTYPLYGPAHLAQLVVEAVSNSPFLILLFGDSSYVVGYLRRLGYDLSPVEQTGSNVGTQLVHDAPLSTRVGTGAIVSDGLQVMNADYSSTSFRVRPVTIGERNFLGNDVAFPAEARVGDNCLLATKALVPIDGPVRHDVGLLGSPPFEIPRSRPRDDRFAFLDDPEEVRRRLPAKNRHNALSMIMLLLGRALLLAVMLALVTAIAAAPWAGMWTFAGALLVGVLVALGTSVLFERAAVGFGGLQPHHGSIYDRVFWRHERLWKFYTHPRALLGGTPFQALLLRLAGVRTGRRLYDDGCVVPEKSLTTLGDDVVLNARTVIHGHSLEDGLFTRDRVEIGSGSSLGVGAFVHYGTSVGSGCVLDADSFLMKGEEMAAGTTWAGNPAEPRRDPPPRTVDGRPLVALSEVAPADEGTADEGAAEEDPPTDEHVLVALREVSR